MSAGTNFAILHKGQGLVKKSFRWVPKLLSQDQMDSRVETLAAFIKMVQDEGRTFWARSSLWASYHVDEQV
jgi:hypothetical protein